MRLGVYTDYSYRREGERIYAQRAFAVFLAEVTACFDDALLVGRLEPEAGRSHYRLPPELRFVPLPHYPSLTRPLASIPAAARSIRRFWRVLDQVDVVWLLGPQGLALPFLVLALLRRRRAVLGVRQDLPRYVRSRHPGRLWIHVAALLLEGAFRALARRHPVVVVGPELGRRYRRARACLVTTVSLVREADLAAIDHAHDRSYDGSVLRALSVGRLESEKNPLMLADVLARLKQLDPRWRLTVCGEGPMRADLEDRLRALGVADRAELLGYIPIDAGLLDVYRRSHALLHVSWTEGLPQILYEAFAARLPVVATAVGGVPDAVGDGALLAPPGDPDAAADALARIAAAPELRARLVESGLARVRDSTMEAESRRIAAFLSRA